MTKLSTAELEAIRDRVEKATEGPWNWDGYLTYRKNGLLEPLMSGGTFGEVLIEENDANFIAHARTDIPKLLAEIERLKINLRDVQQELTKVTQLLDGAYEILHDDVWYRNHPLAVDIIRYFERG